jgi:hypothetical protein
MFTTNKLRSMNCDRNFASKPWINLEHAKDENTTYKIYATNNATLSGREYIALPSNLNLTNNSEGIKKYNIMK